MTMQICKGEEEILIEISSGDIENTGREQGRDKIGRPERMYETLERHWARQSDIFISV